MVHRCQILVDKRFETARFGSSIGVAAETVAMPTAEGQHRNAVNRWW
jgi:hypothetical protein